MTCSDRALVECTRLVLAAGEKTITDVLGSPDDMKFRSCMTLFDADSNQEIFAEAIAAFYPDGKDRATLAILETNQHLSYWQPENRELHRSLLVLPDVPKRTG
jgi:uncharacterized protein (DUF1810 family)